jgi:prenyltransferase beta subunit
LALATAGAIADESEADLAKFEDQIDQATDRALVYLARQQQADGSFGAAGAKANSAITSLSVMAFLAKGHTPGAGPYGRAINRGIDFVLSCQRPNGVIVSGMGGPMYSHGISTLMLSEVSGMVDEPRQRKIDRALASALKVVLAAQQTTKPAKQQGGWRYQHNAPDSDISCSGWALMALRSARNAGCEVPLEAVNQGVEFIMNCRAPDGGFAYQPGGASGLARTGTGLLCLALCGKHDDKAALEAGQWILKHLPRTAAEPHFYYELYYATQGMFQLGGGEWSKWAGHIYPMMLQFQVKEGAEAGSFPQAAGGEAAAGPCYSTVMSVLALTVSCRQLPIYQR